jgi:hypothetical protein
MNRRKYDELAVGGKGEIKTRGEYVHCPGEKVQLFHAVLAEGDV